MSKELSEYSAETLLALLYDDDDAERDEDFRSKAMWSLIGRWDRGVELAPLIKLLQSKESRDRSIGAWYLRELCGPIEGLKEAVIGLADDRLFDCRWSVPYFMLNSSLYDDTIAMKLAELLVDNHLVVRKQVIEWAVHTTDERFEGFSKLIESGASITKYRSRDPAFAQYWGASEQKRAMRGLEIARRLRDWEAAEDIRADIAEEDSFVFDGLHFSRRIIQRWLERRRLEARGSIT
jgi:hypothetical protein